MKNNDIPFSPGNEILRDLLKDEYILKVSKWLLGKNKKSILAQASGSAWESALTIITLNEVFKILTENDEFPEIREEIAEKSILVVEWLLSKKVVNNTLIHWEGVTWDTAVIIQSFLVVLIEYKELLTTKQVKEIEYVSVQSCKWLYYRFNQWDSDIKYPFGAADVSRLLVTFIKFYETNRKLYEKMKSEYKIELDISDKGYWLSSIVEYLLHAKTVEEILVIGDGKNEEVIIHWWDDYFTTAEVTEGLAVYYSFCNKRKKFKSCNKGLLENIKDSLIRACVYFEQGQIDGMWGSHIDTLKVIYSYILIRRLVKVNQSDTSISLMEPEIHTVFKSLRWMCDEKQRFSDGSFMHTMFLTVFFATSLVEVYKSWNPAQDKIDKIYDDVVWASPVRTTPERIKRLSVEMKYSTLQDDIHEKDNEILELNSKSQEKTYNLISIVLVLVLMLFITPILVYTGVSIAKIEISINTDKVVFADLLAYIATMIPLLGAVFTAIFKRNFIFQKIKRGK